ncbi:DUF3489 domain-containing protein [Tsuneonella sp. YG55]|uniref:DUF3489 domain-containing protein n=1 Tax=Tsuneonella litorea TaxID=2976475 RepID=A0A9X3AAT7_9SPHN|nr:DUF3489 domain-containing protein [Tsuneonella litorea]MCT2560220.1 DUF3489 domain-containing protein [Tsuneonella litorea]
MTSTTKAKRNRRMAREPKAEAASNANNAAAQPEPAQEQANADASKKPNKTEAVLALLKRTQGTTLDELVEATGWLPHTTRAALTGLKKKGHSIERTKVDGVSRYALAELASQ